MSDSTTSVLPASDVALGGWSLTGGATAHAVLSDASDASYVDGAGSAGAVLRVGLAAATLGPFDLLRYVRPWIRAATPDAVARTVAVRLYGNGVHQVTPEQTVTLSGTPTRYDLLPYQGWPTGRPFSAADLAAMFLAIRETYNPIGAAYLYEAGVDLVFNGAPTVVITFPTGVPITANGLVSPTWSYSDPEGDIQGRYQLRVYGVPPSGWPAAGLSNDEQIAALDAANVQPIANVEEIGDLGFAAAILLPPFGTFREYLRASDQNSNGRYGSWQRTDFTTAIADAPAMPALVVTPDATVARVRLDLTPGAGSIDYYEIQRSADQGATWDSVLGMRPTLPFVSASANLLDGSAFDSDGNGDGVADAWSLYSTPGGDAAPTGSIVAGVGGGNAQRVAWVGNTGAKGVGTAPRAADSGTDIWEANSEWLVSFQYASDFADASMLPELVFDAGGFAVTWLEQPTPDITFQRYTARVVAPGSDTVSRLTVASTGGANHRFDLAQPQLIAEARLAQTGIGVPPIGSEPLGGPGGPATVTNPLTPPAWTARESTPTTVYDRTAPREDALLYRARAVALSGSGGAYGETAKASPWRTSAPATLAADGNTWVHSSSDGGLDAPFCDARTVMTGVGTEDQAAYSAEGRPDLIVVSGTIHTEQLGGFTFAFADDAEWRRFVLLRSLREPLLVQTLYGEGPLEQFWVKIGAQVSTERHGAYVGQRQAQVRIATFDAWQVAEPA